MISTILVYGATGFSGRLVAAEGKHAGMSDDEPRGSCRMVLAGRDGAAVARVAEGCAMSHRAFGLEDHANVVRHLRDVDVVLNAAGPFAWTAEPLVRAALDADCDYVDLNGEVDVYKTLDDFGYVAERLGRALVCGAGYSAAASNVLLDCALRELQRDGRLPGDGAPGEPGELGSVRIAWSRLPAVSPGTARSAWRSVREQVTVVRATRVDDRGRATAPRLVFWHEPVGMREVAFDFRSASDRAQDGEPRPAIAAAVSSVDTLAARITLARRRAWAHGIESYFQVGTLSRLAYTAVAAASPLSAVPGVAPLVDAPLELLAPPPTPDDLDPCESLLLQIEDRFRTRIVDWRLETPNVYQSTAQLAVEIARRTAQARGAEDARGWRTPAEVLGDCRPLLDAARHASDDAPLRNFVLEKRRTT